MTNVNTIAFGFALMGLSLLMVAASLIISEVSLFWLGNFCLFATILALIGEGFKNE